MSSPIKWTVRSANVLKRTQEEAKRHGSASIYPEHLLSAMILEDGGVASEVLRSDLQLDPAQVVAVIDRVRQRYSNGTISAIEPDLSDGMAQILNFAYREAGGAGHPYIGTEHLLLALAASGDRAVKQVLGELNVTPQAIREKLHARVPAISPTLSVTTKVRDRLSGEFYHLVFAYVPKVIRKRLWRE